MGIEIRVTPARELFFNEENFFGIYAVNVHPDDIGKVKLNQWSNISVKGSIPRLNINEEYTMIVKEDTGSQYTGSYIIELLKQNRPETVAEQKTFLGSILTELQVKNIYDVYSEEDDIVGMIEEGTFDYSKIKGIGDATFEKLKKKVLDNIDMSEILTFLAKYDIKYNMIAKLVDEYGNSQIVMQKIEENPYLLTEVKGIGFKKADEIAKAVGYSMTSGHRIESCIRYCIEEENHSGHSWVEYKSLLNKAIDLLNISKSYIENVLENGVKDVVNIDGKYTLKYVYESEKFVAMKMIQYKTQSKKVFETEELNKMIDEYCENNNVELEENQRQFFHDWNENAILMLIGGGGMGKSWLQNILLQFIDKKNLSVALLAPTGRASKVMTGYTGRQASTIHRKAGVFEDGDGVKEIMEDIIIIDESSMCDIFILAKFFRALKNSNARILFVGDDFQLPSVGVGNFLYDIINSSSIKVSKLKKVFRQSDGGILNVATDTREGKKFLNGSADGRIVFGNDCVFWLVDSDYIADGVVSNYKKALNSGRWTQDDMVILTPTNKGRLGTIELNKKIQKIANPPSANKKEKKVGRKDNPTIFRVGDIVMNTVNTYDMETVDGGTADVFNGDTGRIIDIDDEDKAFVIEFDGIAVKIKFGDILGTIVHAWAVTIHKSQGSQYKVVILVADKSMTYQLNANLLYTGESRAQEYLLVLTQAQTINRAMGKFANMERRSFMQDLLHQYNAERDNVATIEDVEEYDLDDSEDIA